MIVQKNVFEMPLYVTEGGDTIRDVRIGWESYGELNADKSNAILVCHYFSGTSHAAGRYDAGDALPGYWDDIIGPGKALDTERYFVISSDTLVNQNAYDPNVVTTGPASLDPETGKPYGLAFPVVTIRDFVNVQKALLDDLGITRLNAVLGPSMGALQSYEWALAYPEMVDRIVPVIGAAGGDPYLMAWLDLWAAPIKLDPAWAGGDYYGAEPPLAGITAAIRVVSLHANQAEWAADFGREPADPARDPARDIKAGYKISDVLQIFAADRARTTDANHFLYLVRANQLARADAAKIKVPTLLIHAPSDQLFPPAWIERTAAAIAGNGTRVERFALEGPNGHLNGVLHMRQAGEAIARFLAS